MANLYIQEYEKMALTDTGHGQAGHEPALGSQKIVYTTSAASGAFSSKTRFIRVMADADAHLFFASAAPVATNADMLVKADTPEYFGVEPGSRVAAYDGTS